ncbi:cryptochrome/photolyase family protein [Shimia abyssi]|uniref:Deoxyribodipyrimidine photo-lyase type I n=1 Tax=Shimia abyssi TaxID=1662395 RepID=A0A2P8F6D2_9RHOB|nr:deoxyribodipyrimidine photo-lyase [Shimia abyssi]PSL17252.1 deoxyribodipyrimidine photo-lyase type I [Shimia abyssi]
MKQTIVLFRRDLRLSDHPALTAAADRGAVIPVVLLDDAVTSLGGAAKMRLGLSLACFSADLEKRGMRVILRRGEAASLVHELIRESGADAVYWSRRYDPDGVATDTALKAGLSEIGVEARSYAGTLLFEPWTVETGAGGPFRVYSPFWKAVRGRVLPNVLPIPKLIAPDAWPASDALDDWHLSRDMQRGAEVVARHVSAGEAASVTRLDDFVVERIDAYKDARDFMDRDATSGLSDALSVGEISPLQCWAAGQRAMEEGKRGAEHFLKEVVWREFAWHLMWHFPTLDRENWRAGWDRFEWIEDEAHPHYLAWCQGRTGVALVDAAMRELYVTGKMHNRARMITASYLTKHLRSHWRLGLKWFQDCLVDWDAASNAMGWQWVAGSGPDAAPFFRIFNPDRQADQFDARQIYRRRWLADRYGAQDDHTDQFHAATPKSWHETMQQPVLKPIVGLKQGRDAALAAYGDVKSQ